ncbi:Na+/H+ antiporter subunit E [Geoalkalibacter subterraneus]|nr:Na+/H+ antiporter subunit E [Geoalkalibacter subterraneus]
MAQSHIVMVGLRYLAAFVLLWEIIAGWSSGSWGMGSVAVLIATAVALCLRSREAGPLRWSGAIRFLPYFFLQSVRGGVDVARRAFSPGMQLEPLLVEHPLSLPPGAARLFLVNVVSLLPGTLGADVRKDCLVVHALDRSLAGELVNLEQKVARLFDADGVNAL